MTLQYNRNRLFAVATGILCALVFTAGTALGGFHSISTLGAFGILSLACYVILDLAVVVASILDYMEDGNIIEWSAWGVKVVGTIFLLFSGGCIAWVLFENAAVSGAQKARVEAATSAYKDCVASAKTRADKNRCTQLASNIQKNETDKADADAETRKENAGWVAKYVEWPLFKYLPGILGAICLFFLGLVAKINGFFEDSGSGGKKSAQEKEEPEENEFPHELATDTPAKK